MSQNYSETNSKQYATKTIRALKGRTSIITWMLLRSLLLIYSNYWEIELPPYYNSSHILNRSNHLIIQNRSP